jgi:glutamyl-tRNA reductase
VLVIGAGRMARLVAQTLASQGASIAFVANRSLDRAEQLAGRFGARALEHGRIDEALPGVDLIVSATAGTAFVLRTVQIERALQVRPGRRLCLIDLAVPRDIEPSAAALKGCVLHTIDDLHGIVRRGRAARRHELGRAEAIVDEELEHFRAWRSSLVAVPAIASLRARAEEIRMAELAKAERRLRGFTEPERQIVDRVTTQLVSRLLHLPTVRLKQAASAADGPLYVGAACHLFGLDDDASAPD